MCSLVASICDSKSFVKSTFGFSPTSLARARSKVDLTLALSAKMEMVAMTVRSDVTVGGQNRLKLRTIREMKTKALSDDHAGRAAPIA